MKKLLILILITLLIVLAFIIAIDGVNIGNIKILGISQIQARSQELDKKIQEAGKLAQTDFKKIVSDVQNEVTELEEKKQNYIELLPDATEEQNQVLPTLKKYEIETLWVKIGNHATKEGAVIKMDVVETNGGVRNMSGQQEKLAESTTTNQNEYSYYDLKFTVNGSYIAITDFVSDIENDDELGFKIEEFKLVPSSGSELQATFVCRDIAINISEVTQTNTDTNAVGSNATNTNTTNTNATNTNATNTNTTNSNNTNTTNATNKATMTN